MNKPITYATVSGKELDRTITKLEKAMEGETTQNVMMACLVEAILIQAPDIESTQLIAAVKGASEWIALFASGESTLATPERMN